MTTAQTLMGLGLRFIGVVKTATRKFPMIYLSSLELTEESSDHEVTWCILDNGPCMGGL